MKPNGIDISEFQNPSTFDYQAVKDAGIKDLIIREGHGLKTDKSVEQHIANAKKYGLRWHLYHYWENASGEVQYAVNHAKQLGLSSNQVFFLDMEGNLSGNWNDEFMSFYKVAKDSFRVGLYTSDSPYKTKFDDSQLQKLGVIRWIASYSYEPKNYDIWQMSGAGGGGFGTYKNDVDRDYIKNNILTYSEYSTPPHYEVPVSYRNIVLQPGYDTETGIYGLGCSFDNGVIFKVYWTIYGRKFYQEDADRLWPFLTDKVKSAMSGSLNVDWSSIQNKPNVALKSDIPSLDGYAKTSDIPTSMAWNQITNKPSLALTSDIPSLDGYAKLNDIPSVSGLVKETELADYAKKSDIPTMPDLSSYATISSLLDYVKKTDLPDFTLFAKKSDIPTIPTDLVHTSDLNGFAKKSDLPAEQDLSNYAKKSDLNNYVTNETYSENESNLENALEGLIEPIQTTANNNESAISSLQTTVNSNSNSIQSLQNSLGNQNQVQTITSGTLADLANKQGSYHYEIDYIPSDAPSGVYAWGMLDVVVGDHYAKQVFTVTGAMSNNGRVFVRVRGYGSSYWNEWREITLWN